MNKAQDKLLAMVTSSPATNDVASRCHLLRSPATMATMTKSPQPPPPPTVTTTTMVQPLINHSHQCHYSIVKQKPTLPLTIEKCHSSSPLPPSPVVNYCNPCDNLDCQDVHLNGNLMLKTQKKLNFSIDAILNSEKSKLICKSEGLTHFQQQLNSTGVTIDKDEESVKIASPPKCGPGGKKVALSVKARGPSTQRQFANVLNVLHTSEDTDRVNVSVDGGTSSVEVSPVIKKSAKQVQSESFGDKIIFGPNVMCHQEKGNTYHETNSSSPVSPTTSDVLQKLSLTATCDTNDHHHHHKQQQQQQQLVSNCNIRRKCTSRGPRIPFTPDQVAILEAKFKLGHYLSSREVFELSCQLDISEQRVKIWFQNRRARHKKNQGKNVTTTTTTATATTTTSTTGHGQGYEEKMHQEQIQ